MKTLLAAILLAILFTAGCKKQFTTGPDIFEPDYSSSSLSSTNVSSSLSSASNLSSSSYPSSSPISSSTPSSSSSSIPTSLGANLIVNGDFSSGTTGWFPWTWTGGGMTADFNVVSGQYVVNNIVGDGSSDHYSTVVNNINLVQGKQYYISLKAKADAPRNITVTPRLGADPYTWYQTQIFSLTTTLTTYSYTYTHTAATDPLAQFIIFFGGSSSAVYLDDISIQEILPAGSSSSTASTSSTASSIASSTSSTASSVSSGSCTLDTVHVTVGASTPASPFSPQTIYQNDFTSGANNLVLYSGNAGASGVATIVSGQMQIAVNTVTGTAWHLAVSQYLGGIPLVNGHNYTFTMDAKITSGTTKMTTVVLQENGGAYNARLAKDLYLDTTMKTYTVKWRPFVSDPNTRLLFWVGDDLTDVVIDNIKLVDNGPVETPGTITTSTGVPLFNTSCANFQQGAGTASAFNSTEPGTYNTQYNYQSISAGTTVGLDVVLPPSYTSQPTKRYPVIFYLHGHGETEATIKWNNIDQMLVNAMNAGTLSSEVILVSVGGPAEAWWSDNYTGTVKAESHIVYEVLSLVDQNFRTIGTKQSRAIMGFSMGGFGAAKIAIKYPKFFAVCATWCGALYSSGPVGGSLNGFWDGCTVRNSIGFTANYISIWNDDPNDYAYDCGRALLSSQASQVQSEGIKFFVQENIRQSDGYQDQFYSHSQNFVSELQAKGITATFSSSTINVTDPHTPANITPTFINSMLNAMQVVP